MLRPARDSRAGCLAEHRRRTGGAAGEDECSEIVVVDLDGLHLLRTEQIVERGVGAGNSAVLGGHHVLHARQPCTIDVGPGTCSLRLDHHDLGTDREDLALDLWCGRHRVERHRDRSEAQGREVEIDEVAPVAAQQRDAIALTDAESDQPAAHMGDLLA